MGRTIAIGDIHGCASAFRTLLGKISPACDDVIVTLGDYVDRGPSSREVIDELLELDKQCQLVPLMGNHELILLSAAMTKETDFWYDCGGRQTLESYGGDLSAIPEWHLDFLRGCRRYHEASGHIFVHACYNPYVPMENQPDHLLFWTHLPSPPPAPHYSKQKVICGHTPQTSGEVLDLGHVACIDTFAVGGGSLTALEVASGEVWQVQQNASN